VSRRVDVRHLVGTKEIAARLGVARPQVVHDWRRRHGDDSEYPFPAPIATVSGVHVWYWPEVQTWAKATGRLKGQ